MGSSAHVVELPCQAALALGLHAAQELEAQLEQYHNCLQQVLLLGVVDVVVAARGLAQRLRAPFSRRPQLPLAVLHRRHPRRRVLVEFLYDAVEREDVGGQFRGHRLGNEEEMLGRGGVGDQLGDDAGENQVDLQTVAEEGGELGEDDVDERARALHRRRRTLHTQPQLAAPEAHAHHADGVLLVLVETLGGCELHEPLHRLLHPLLKRVDGFGAAFRTLQLSLHCRGDLWSSKGWANEHRHDLLVMDVDERRKEMQRRHALLVVHRVHALYQRRQQPSSLSLRRRRAAVPSRTRRDADQHFRDQRYQLRLLEPAAVSRRVLGH
mmetsp:Transcript_14682/g.34839  ORF Transcript_14682/g.34839 Transcript_14682/m.34839 type:complete len:324 (-) Transcript_14682:1251-2222(-)